MSKAAGRSFKKKKRLHLVIRQALLAKFLKFLKYRKSSLIKETISPHQFIIDYYSLCFGRLKGNAPLHMTMSHHEEMDSLISINYVF